MTGVYIGIDPGNKGAIARLANGQLTVVDMPTIKLNGRTLIDTWALRGILADWGASTLVALEDVNAGAVQGRMSAFAFGRGFGRIEGVLEATGRAHVLVTPNTWTKAIGRKDGKAGSLTLCRQLWPELDWPATKDGRADAALIAEWARRTDGGGR